MGHKHIDVWSDVQSQSDVIHGFAPNRGAEVIHEGGKMYRIQTEKGAIHLNDNCRAMPKQEREMVKFWMFCLGLIGSAVLGIFVWLLS